MSNEILANKNTDLQDSNNSKKVLDESPDHQTNDSKIISLITIQLVQDSKVAFVSIGIKNVAPIIRSISIAELKDQSIINSWLEELEKSLPAMLATCKQKGGNKDEDYGIKNPKQVGAIAIKVQKRDQPEKLSNQLSLFES